MTGWPLPCTCPLALDCCDLDRPQCPHFYDATYVEIEAGLYDILAEMARDDADPMYRALHEELHPKEGTE